MFLFVTVDLGQNVAMVSSPLPPDLDKEIRISRLLSYSKY